MYGLPCHGEPFALPAGVLDGLVQVGQGLFRALGQLVDGLAHHALVWWQATAAAPTAMPTAVPAIVENCITMPPFRVLVPSMPRVGAAMQQNEAENQAKKQVRPIQPFFMRRFMVE